MCHTEGFEEFYVSKLARNFMSANFEGGISFFLVKSV